MSSKGYTVLGWLVWQFATRRLVQNRSKIAAIAAILGIVAAGIALAGGDDD